MVLLVHRLVFVYIDDYCGAEANSEDAWRSYRGLTELLMSLGLYLSYEKCYSPRTTLVWIGVEFNTLNMTMQIDPKKVAEVHALVFSWLDCDVSWTEKELDSLVGKLFHVIKCARSARPYLCHLQDTQKHTSSNGPAKLSEGAKADLRWLAAFMANFHRVHLLPTARPTVVITVDSCTKVWAEFVAS